MNLKEKAEFQKVYTERYEVFVRFEGDSKIQAETELKLMDRLISTMLGNEAKREMKNNAIMSVHYDNSKYVAEHFEVIETWINKITKETGEKFNNFEYTMKGLKRLVSHYDWIDKETYKGFFLAVSNTQNAIENKIIV